MIDGWCLSLVLGQATFMRRRYITVHQRKGRGCHNEYEAEVQGNSAGTAAFELCKCFIHGIRCSATQMYSSILHHTSSCCQRRGFCQIAFSRAVEYLA